MMIVVVGRSAIQDHRTDDPYSGLRSNPMPSVTMVLRCVTCYGDSLLNTLIDAKFFVFSATVQDKNLI
jgi:hypothetical protein